MKFAGLLAPKADDWRLICELEALDFDAAWVADSHMIWSDCYGILALAAENTSRIMLGTGVTNPGTRIAPVTANAIATVNRIAPGRTFLGIGTGFSSLMLMGREPVKAPAFRDYLRVVRGLLHGEEVEYTVDGETRVIRFLDVDRGFLETEQKVPIYVAADGPLALKAAGAFGDGCVTGGYSLTAQGREGLAQRVAKIKAGAAEVGRVLPDDFQMTTSARACLLMPGETAASQRVIEQIGATVACTTLHTWWEMAQKGADPEKLVPDYAWNIWERYLAHIDGLGLTPANIHQRIHRGHATYVLDDERQFITPDLIRAAGMFVGPPDEIIDSIRAREADGIHQVTVMPAVEKAREYFRDFSREIIRKY